MRANDIRVLTALPYAFCDTEINGLRLAVSYLKIIIIENFMLLRRTIA